MFVRIEKIENGWVVSFANRGIRNVHYDDLEVALKAVNKFFAED